MAPHQSRRTLRAELGHLQSQSSPHNQRIENRNEKDTKRPQKDALERNHSTAGDQLTSTTLSDGESNDEDDSNHDADMDDDDEDDETEGIAPFHGTESNGKRTLQHDRGTGLSNGNSLAVPLAASRKRRLSNMSNVSVLDESTDDDGGIPVFPRKKKTRTLSNDYHGLLAYTSIQPSLELPLVPEDVIESSDDDDDDDDIYQAVNFISDGEEDADVEKHEERVMLRAEEKQQRDGLFSAYGSNDPLSRNLLFDTPERQLGELYDFAFDNVEHPQDAVKGANARKYSTGSIKRVRFWDEQSADDDSNSSASSDFNAMFPDIFADQDKPLIQHLLGNDTDGDQILGESDSDRSYWDFSDNEQSSPSKALVNERFDDESDGTSSGYDSEGETTDEEAQPPRTIRSPQTLLHRSSSSGSETIETPRKPFKRSSSFKAIKAAKAANAGSGPRWGNFSADPKKATAFTDVSGRRVIVHPPEVFSEQSRFFGESSTSSIVNSPIASILVTPGETNELANLSPHEMSNPRDIMFAGTFGMPSWDPSSHQHGHLVAPPELWFPFSEDPLNEEGEYSEYDDDVDSDDIDLEDFLAISDGSDDEDLLETSSQAVIFSDFPIPNSECPDSTPIQRTRSVGETMLEHFDRTPGVVSSFRSNQDKYRNIASQHPNPDLRASNSQAVRYGKSAETPITPVRKKRVNSRRKAPPLGSPIGLHNGK